MINLEPKGYLETYALYMCLVKDDDKMFKK